MLQRLVLGILAAGALALLIWLVVLAFTSDESLIADVVESSATKFEELHPGGVLKHISEDYEDSLGYNRDRIRLVLLQIRTLYSEAKIDYGGLKITIDGDKATAWLRVSVDLKTKAGKWVSAKDVSGGRRMSNAIELTLAREGWKTWRIIQVESAPDPQTNAPQE